MQHARATARAEVPTPSRRASRSGRSTTPSGPAGPRPSRTERAGSPSATTRPAPRWRELRDAGGPPAQEWGGMVWVPELGLVHGGYDCDVDDFLSSASALPLR